MDNKNSKSDNYIVRMAEDIIDEYIEKRENSDIQNYYMLRKKYEQLKILTISIIVAIFFVTLINVIINKL